MFPARRLPPRLQIVGKSWHFLGGPVHPEGQDKSFFRFPLPTAAALHARGPVTREPVVEFRRASLLFPEPVPPSAHSAASAPLIRRARRTLLHDGDEIQYEYPILDENSLRDENQESTFEDTRRQTLVLERQQKDGSGNLRRRPPSWLASPCFRFSSAPPIRPRCQGPSNLSTGERTEITLVCFRRSLWDIRIAACRACGEAICRRDGKHQLNR